MQCKSFMLHLNWYEVKKVGFWSTIDAPSEKCAHIICLWCLMNVDAKTLASSLILHFLSSSLCFIPPNNTFSLSHYLTWYLISCLLSVSHPRRWQSTRQRWPRKDSLCCISVVLGKLVGRIWLSYSNLCRVQHCQWRREKVGCVNAEKNHSALNKVAHVLISFKSSFWMRLSLKIARCG